MSLAPAPLRAIVEDRFRPRGGDAVGVGLELESLPVRAADGRAVPLEEGSGGAGTLSVLRPLAAARGWEELDQGYGAPAFRLGDGALLSFEPGGQLEYSSAVHRSLASLDAAVRETWERLGEAMASAGIRLLARGLDPVNPASHAAMLLDAERYRRQRGHYDRRGNAGRTMMLRTAGAHLNLDFGPAPFLAWDAANAIMPHLLAMCANAPISPEADLAPEPWRSYRAAAWRRLDPSRTRVFPPSDDPIGAYLDFALDAESFLLGAPEEPPRRFRDWRAAGASDDDFRRHLSTLFPEVRPRGYLELRAIDALPAHWAIVPLALAQTALHAESPRRVLLRELPAPSLARMERAGRLGLADPALADELRWLLPLLLDALGAQQRDTGDHGILARVEEFLDRFTRQGRDPGADPEATT